MGENRFVSPSNRWIVGGAILALVIGGIGMLQFVQQQSSEVMTTESNAAPVKPDQLGITALGRIEPEGEILNISGPSGERILRLLVQQGQRVAQGQPIAYLESYPERLAERDLAADQLTEAQSLLASERQVGQAQVQEARTRMEQVSTPKSNQILAQTATIERLKAELALAQKDFRRFQDLQRSGAVSQKDLDDRTLALRSKQEEINNAVATLAQLEQERQTDLENAKAQLQATEMGAQRSLVQVQVASAASNLKLAAARLERTIIRAPRAGQILKVLIKEGEAIALVTGESSSSAQAIVQLANTNQMYVVAEVYETDIRRVKVGQVATIMSSAIEEKLQGTVDQIGLKIDKNDVLDIDPVADTDARVVEVKIRLRDSRPVASLTNLQVEVVIHPQG